MTNKEIVSGFFIEGYEHKNYDFLINYVSDDYKDNSPAAAKGNKEAIEILKAVDKMFDNLKVEIMDMLEEKEKVAVRVKFDGIHVGECMGISASRKHISFEALEIFKIVDNKIVESWGYWPDKEIEQKLRL